MTLIFAHRGSKGTHPENTLIAFKEAINVKADGIELDVQLSKDNELVIIHDGDVKRTTNGTGLIKNLTLNEIKQLDAGSWFDSAFKDEKIPTFEEVLQLLVDENYQGILNIEIKTDEHDYEGIEANILASLKKYPLSCGLLLSSFNPETMKRVIALDNTIEKAIILDKSNKKIQFCVETEEIKGMHPSIKWIKENTEFVKTFEKNLRPWTVNSEEDILLSFELGLAAIHTDFPEKAMSMKETFYEKR